jgi:hypothetical protein
MTRNRERPRVASWIGALLERLLERVRTTQREQPEAPPAPAPDPVQPGPSAAQGSWARWAPPLAAGLRRHQNALLAGAIGLGIVLMIIHWSGSPRDGNARANLPRPALTSGRNASEPPRPEPRADASTSPR